MLCPVLLFVFFARGEKERNAAAQELEENVVQLQQDRQDKGVSEKNGKMISNNISDMTGRWV